MTQHNLKRAVRLALKHMAEGSEVGIQFSKPAVALLANADAADEAPPQDLAGVLEENAELTARVGDLENGLEGLLEELVAIREMMETITSDPVAETLLDGTGAAEEAPPEDLTDGAEE